MKLDYSNITKEELSQINNTFIEFPVQVTCWPGYGIVREVKDETTFVVENKYGEKKDVDMFYLRSLNEFEIDNYFKPAFEACAATRGLNNSFDL